MDTESRKDILSDLVEAARTDLSKSSISLFNTDNQLRKSVGYHTTAINSYNMAATGVGVDSVGDEQRDGDDEIFPTCGQRIVKALISSLGAPISPGTM